MTMTIDRTEDQLYKYLRTYYSEQEKALALDETIQNLNSERQIREKTQGFSSRSMKFIPSMEDLETEVYRAQVQLGALKTENEELRSQVNRVRREVLEEKRIILDLRTDLRIVEEKGNTVKRKRTASGSEQFFDNLNLNESQDFSKRRKETSNKVQTLISPRKLTQIQIPVPPISAPVARFPLLKTLVMNWKEKIRSQRAALLTHQTHIKLLNTAFQGVQDSSPSETAQTIIAWFRSETLVRRYLLSLQDETNSLKVELEETRTTIMKSSLFYDPMDTSPCDFLGRFQTLQLHRPVPELKSFLKRTGFASSNSLISTVTALKERVQDYVEEMRKTGRLEAIKTSQCLDALSVLCYPFQELRTVLATLGLKYTWMNEDFSLEMVLEQIFDLEDLIEKLVKFLIYHKRIAPISLLTLERRERKAVSVPEIQIEARAEDLYPLSQAELRKRATLHFHRKSIV